MRRLLTALALVISGIAMFALTAQAETLRVSVLKFGTVNWELDTIKRRGLDAANGFQMEVAGVGGSAAARIAFQAGEADVIVADWIWVARQRAAGKDYVFLPYSKAVGGLVVAPDSPVRALSDLAGKSIGIAGGPVDKSWLILQAYAAQELGMDLKGATEQVFGAPPLMFKKGLQGEIDGIINFWHFMAKMKAKGFREIASVAEAATALGLNPDTPLLGYVFKGRMAAETPGLIDAFAKASRQAKDLLARDDTAWEDLRGRMKPKSEAEFQALIAGFRAGIPAGPVDVDAAADMLALMARLGGEKLVGKAATLPDGVFYGLGG